MKSTQVSLRREAILKVERNNQSHLEVKYKFREEITRKKLLEAQNKTLLANIKSKQGHERLFKTCQYDIADIKSWKLG